MSLNINDVVEALQKLKVPAATIIAVENELEALQAEQEAEKADVPPKAKNQTHLVLIDPENKLAGLGDFVGFSVQISVDSQPADSLGKIFKAAYAQNASGKKKKWNIKSLGEIGDIKRKFLREQNIAIKSGKEPVSVIVTNGVVPVA